MQNQILAELNQTEFNRTLGIMNETTYANQKMIGTLYRYKYNDEMHQIEIANDVCREYHAGKFDPGARRLQPRRKKVQRRKRSVY